MGCALCQSSPKFASASNRVTRQPRKPLDHKPCCQLQLHAAHAAAEAQARPWLLESRSSSARPSATGWQQDSASGGNRFIQARSRARRPREAQGSIASTSSSSPSDYSNHMAKPSQKRRRPGSASQAHGCVHVRRGPLQQSFIRGFPTAKWP